MNEDQFKFVNALLQEVPLEKSDIQFDTILKVDSHIASRSDSLDYIGNTLAQSLFGYKCSNILKKDEDTYIFCTEHTNFYKLLYEDSEQLCSWYSYLEILIAAILERLNVIVKVEILKPEKNIAFLVKFI